MGADDRIHGLQHCLAFLSVFDASVGEPTSPLLLDNLVCLWTHDDQDYSRSSAPAAISPLDGAAGSAHRRRHPSQPSPPRIPYGERLVGATLPAPVSCVRLRCIHALGIPRDQQNHYFLGN